MFYFFGNIENFNTIFAARKQAMLQLYNVAMIKNSTLLFFFFKLREYARDFLKCVSKFVNCVSARVTGQMRENYAICVRVGNPVIR